VAVDLGALSEQELLVLVGLVKLVVHADREVTPAEREILGRLQATIGAETWNAAVRTARDRYTSIEQLEHDARAVERAEVRRAVHETLVEIAGADEVIEAEAQVLQWVVQEWGLADEPAPAEEFVVADDD
jgi:hypothetical protein